MKPRFDNLALQRYDDPEREDLRHTLVAKLFACEGSLGGRLFVVLSPVELVTIASRERRSDTGIVR